MCDQFCCNDFRSPHCFPANMFKLNEIYSILYHVVSRELVEDSQLTGNTACLWLVDESHRRAPIVIISVDTPHLCGTVEAVCLANAAYGLMIGNVPGARAASDPDPHWQAATTADPQCSCHSQPTSSSLPQQSDAGSLSSTTTDIHKQQWAAPQQDNSQHGGRTADLRKTRDHPSFKTWTSKRMKMESAQ